MSMNEAEKSKAEKLVQEIAKIERPFDTSVATFVSILFSMYLYKYLELEEKETSIKKDAFIKRIKESELNFNGLKDEIIRVLDNFLIQYYLDEILPVAKDYAIDDIKNAIVNFRFSNFYYSEFQSSDSLINLGHRILKEDKDDKVLDFCSGIGSFIVDSSMKGNIRSIDGVELSLEAYSASVLRCSLLDIKDSLHLYIKDAMMMEGKYDKIFANIPPGLRYDEEKYSNFISNSPELKGIRNMDWLFAKKISMLLNPDNQNAKAVVFMLFNPLLQRIGGLKEARNYFLKMGLIEAVIQLPSKVMYPTTPHPVCAVILSHKEENMKRIKMVKADDIYHEERRRNVLLEEDVNKIVALLEKEELHSRYVDMEEIYNNELSLIPSEYLDSGLDIPCGERFKNVILSMKRGAILTSDRLDTMVSKDPTGYQYLQLGDIREGEISKELRYIVIDDDSYDRYVIKKNDLIISKNGLPFKVAVADFEADTKVVGCGNIYFITLDESKVNPYYLKAMFESELGKKILTESSSGSAIKIITVQNIENMRISVPPMHVQDAIAEEYRKAQEEVDRIRSSLRIAEEEKSKIFEKFME